MKKLDLKNIINSIKQNIALKILDIYNDDFNQNITLQKIKQYKELILLLDKTINVEEKILNNKAHNKLSEFILSNDDKKIIENYLKKYKNSKTN